MPDAGRGEGACSREADDCGASAGSAADGAGGVQVVNQDALVFADDEIGIIIGALIVLDAWEQSPDGLGLRPERSTLINQLRHKVEAWRERERLSVMPINTTGAMS